MCFMLYLNAARTDCFGSGVKMWVYVPCNVRCFLPCFHAYNESLQSEYTTSCHAMIHAYLFMVVDRSTPTGVQACQFNASMLRMS